MQPIKVLLSLLLMVISFSDIYGQDMGHGPFDLELSSGKYILKISKKVIDREFKLVTRVAKGFAVTDKYDNKKLPAGREMSVVSAKFTIAADKRIQLVNTANLNRIADVNTPLYKSVAGISNEGIVAVFEQLASSSADTIRIDFTSFIMEDNDYFAICDPYKKMFNLLQYQPAKSVFLFRERFDEGIDFRFTRTYNSTAGNKSVDVNTTFLLLSEKPMTPRFADYRVTGMGFNTQSFNDYSSNPLYVVRNEYAYRYNLYPSKKDEQHYLKGKLVEPVKPIIFYIEPATPKEWLPYMKAGITAWAKTFERAGFKNAVQVREVADDDRNFNIQSARYNTLVYNPSESYGGSADLLIDNRSGEVITSRIQWPHSNPHHLMKRYMVLAGASDIEARSMHMPVSLVGELMKVVVSHEMGHCLGIHHNYLSSSLIPVENLRNKKWVEKNGFTYSIMDYARHNYVAQPEDKIGREGLIPGIGQYDYWAVEWLYKWYPDQNPTTEKEKLDKLYDLRVKKQPELQHINIHLAKFDYRLRMEDVGDDPLKASEYGIRNLKFVAPNILEWTRDQSGEYNYFNALEVYKELFLQLKYFLTHVNNLIGGTTITLNKINSMQISGWVSASRQKEAINFIGENVFKNTEWLLENKTSAALSAANTNSSSYEMLIGLQNYTIEALFDLRKIPFLLTNSRLDQERYTFNELMTDVEEQLFNEITSSEKIGADRKRLQRKYLERIAQLLPAFSKDQLMVECVPVVKEHMFYLSELFKKKINSYSSASERIHLQQLIEISDKNLHF
ncbi:zinc-dependent metalloprotease [Gynurincola endophyticus]|uniref:zinc-dependent metalloprotease n=1 Tax=Gynurincola endophyticus TaxID=2479004 RepID=UPI000F8E0111|nr:zinc-dependent metalloprotease [Gynurincola endophyticus]